MTVQAEVENSNKIKEEAKEKTNSWSAVFSWGLALQLVAAIAVFGLALFWRLQAAENLSTDFDEDDYLRAGQLYAQHLAAGDIAGIIDERENYEHPPLTKLVYGVVLLNQNPSDYANPVIAYTEGRNGGPEIARRAKPLRDFSAWVGAATAGAVAFVNPLAGLLVAVNSWHIKYTSQAMLEALPCFFAAIMLLLLLRSRRNGDGWFWASAVMLGATASGKYLYAVAGIAALGWLFWRERRSWKILLVWGGLALGVFYLLNPALWLNPAGRLWESLAFNANFSQSAHVKNSGFGWAQPAVWLLTAVPPEWLPARRLYTFPVLLDGLFGWLALLALKRLWQNPQQRLLVVWFGVNLLFLFFWTTKWPQYILALTVPVALLAANWLSWHARRLYTAWQTWRTQSKLAGRSGRAKFSNFKNKEALIWLSPVLLFFAALVVYPLILQATLALTLFETRHIGQGAAGLFGSAGRGFLGLPLDGRNSSLYGGTGVLFNFIMWDQFGPMVRFNILWVIFSMGLATAFGLWLAYLLEKPGLRGRNFWRVIFILPWAIPEFIGALIWSTLFDDVTGGVNYILPEGVDWLSTPQPFIDVQGFLKPVISWLDNGFGKPFAGILDYIAGGLSGTPTFWVMVLVGFWVSFPFMLVIASVSLRSVPEEVTDAARVDGAAGWSLWRGITWPMAQPAVWAGVLLRGILLFNAFHLPLMVGTDATRTGTLTISLAAYGSIRYQAGYTAAALLNLIAMGLAFWLIWIFNRRTRVVEGVDYV